MSKIEVDAIDKQSGSTLTLGGSGTAVTLASGATQSGFGRNGSVNWQTSIKTANFTAVSGEGYFCDTATTGAFTLTLPSSPSVGDIVALKDYAGNFATANLTIGRGGSNMNGAAADSVRSTDNESLTLVYADATKGWLAVEEGTGFVGETFLEATGGTITTSGNDKIHTFTGPGTFTVNSVAPNAANNLVSYLVVAGGGGGGSDNSGGGGAGGFRETKSPVTPYTASPLDGYGTPTNRITVTATAFPITVGGGAATQTGGFRGNSGSASTFSTITSAGGGGGGSGNPGAPTGPGLSGGSGGGAYYLATSPGDVGAGNTPPVTPSQGNPGGVGTGPGGGANAGGGGGGATAAGTQGATPPTGSGGDGGAGATTSINGSPTAFAGGGGGGAGSSANGGAGGAGGGGYGSNNPGTPNSNNPGATPVTQAANGTANTGGGGGGSNGANPGATSPACTQKAGGGGSGIVIIRYKFK
jgi:hypothetical protein